MKKQKGITLVALIITIIILLVLATVSISLVINNGVLDKAEKGTDSYLEAEIKEKVNLAYNEWKMDKETVGTSNLEDGMLYLYLPAGTRTINVEVDGNTYSGTGETKEIAEVVTLNKVN